MSKKALKLMKEQAKKGLPIIDNHRSTFEFGKTVDAKIVDLGKSQQLVVTIKLDKRFPESAVIWDEVQSGKSHRQLSIGGMINFDNEKAIDFEEGEDGGMVRVINDIVLEHIAATRKNMAANARAGFLDAIAKSLDDHQITKSFFKGLMFGRIEKENNSKETLDSDPLNGAEYDGQEVKGTDMTSKENTAEETVETTEEVVVDEVTKTETEEVSTEATETPVVEEEATEEVEEATEEITDATEEVEEDVNKSLVAKFGSVLKDLMKMAPEEATEEVTEEVTEEEAVESTEEVEEEVEEAVEEAVEDVSKAQTLKDAIDDISKEDMDDVAVTDLYGSMARLLSFFDVAEKEAKTKDFILSVLADSNVAKETAETVEIAKKLTKLTSEDVVKSIEDVKTASETAIADLNDKLEAKDVELKSLTERLETLEKGAGISHNLGNEEEEASTEKDKGTFNGMFTQALNKA